MRIINLSYLINRIHSFKNPAGNSVVDAQFALLLFAVDLQIVNVRVGFESGPSPKRVTILGQQSAVAGGGREQSGSGKKNCIKIHYSWVSI